MTIAIDARDVRTAQVHEAIEAFFAERARAAARYGPDYARLWRTAAQTVRGGKFVRPELLLVAHGAMAANAPSSPRVIVDAAAAVELLHYAFVLHDDVIDGDQLRRGQPNLQGAVAASAEPSVGQARAAHWAATSGILMGDLMLSGVYQLIAGLDVPATTRSRLLSVLGDTIDETVAGEHADVGLAHGIISPDLGTILAMCANKTATYTFELPLAFAAILADAPPEVVRSLTRAGRHLGLAFQLQDDLLSVFGDPARHGKDAGSDLREAKVTAIIAHARSSAAWPRIEPLLGRELDAAELRRARLLLMKSGAKAEVERHIDEALGGFRAALGDQAVPAGVRAGLLRFASALQGRAA